MKRRSLVGLRALDIGKLLATDGVFAITYHNEAQCLVIPIPKTQREVYEIMERLKKNLERNNDEP